MQIIWFKQSRKSQICDEHGAIIEKPFLACPQPNSPHPHPTRWQLVGYFLICSHARLEAFTVRHVDNFVPLFTNFLALFKDVSLICWISQQRLFLRHVEPDKKMPYLLKRSLETHTCKAYYVIIKRKNTFRLCLFSCFIHVQRIYLQRYFLGQASLGYLFFTIS